MERLLPWIRRSSLVWLAVVVLVGLAARRISSGGEQPQASSEPVAERVVSAPKEYLVHVAGAVRRPGVYRIGGDGRVIQAIRLAGGPTAGANLAGVNLAAPVNDGQQIVVPTRPTPQQQAAAAGVASGPISLSSASVEQLDTLDGIGPTLAARIVAWRDSHGGFQSIDQLGDVPGIGDTRLESLRPHLTL